MAGAASSIESPPGGGGSPLTSIAIVQWTHTLRMQNALLLARQQVLRTRTEAELQPKLAWGHHVLLQSCGKARAEEEADCRSMTRSLASRGLTENVGCCVRRNGRCASALANIRNVFEHRGLARPISPSGPIDGAGTRAMASPLLAWAPAAMNTLLVP